MEVDCGIRSQRHVLEREHQVARALEALLRCFLQTSPHDAVERRRYLGAQAGEIRGCSFKTACSVSIQLSPAKRAGVAASISYSTHPNAKMSDACVGSRSRANLFR